MTSWCSFLASSLARSVVCLLLFLIPQINVTSLALFFFNLLPVVKSLNPFVVLGYLKLKDSKLVSSLFIGREWKSEIQIYCVSCTCEGLVLSGPFVSTEYS